MGAHAQTRLTHDVLFHDSAAELLDTVVCFVRAGLDTGESAVLCYAEPTLRLLDRALDDDPRIALLGNDDVYSTPAGAISAYQEIVDSYVRAGAHRVRVAGEAIPYGTAALSGEWGRYEAVVNRAMERYPVSALCTYDTRRLGDEVLAVGRLTHPRVITSISGRANPDFVDPAEYLRRTTHAGPDALESTTPVLDIEDLVDLDDLRLQLEIGLLHKTRLVQAAADFFLAVNEVATNGIRHGRPPVAVRAWMTPDRLLCTVTDHGDGFDDPFAGYLRPGTGEDAPMQGMGLWLARRVCDRVDVFDGPAGFTVRLLISNVHTPPRTCRHRHVAGGF